MILVDYVFLTLLKLHRHFSSLLLLWLGYHLYKCCRAIVAAVNNCTFSYNEAGLGLLNTGAAIFSSSTSLTVNSSTFYNNQALVGDGGAISASTLVVNNSTFFNNTAQAEGGAIWVSVGTHLTIHNSTIVGNSVISTTAGSSVGDTTVASLLTPLQYNGGPTMTMSPLPGGTGIIGTGLNSTLATDQRGIPRPISGASDLGAVQSYNLVVTTTADSTNAGTTCTSGDTCSLRDALTLANSLGAGDVVTVSGLSGTITLTSPLPDDTADLNINGPGANQLTISGGGAYQVLNITNINAYTNISGVTIANGLAGSTTNGGGVRNAGSLLTLNKCAFTGNSTAAGSFGGGLANLNPNGTATVTNCTFSNNQAQEGGGAIVNDATLVVTNSTFTGNTARNGNPGGGIYNFGRMTVYDSTITGNSAGTGSGIFNPGAATISNSIVAGNTSTTPGDDCGLCGTQNAFNLIATTAAPTDPARLMLAPLAYYGPNQTVQTMLPYPGSPLIQAGDPTQLPIGLTTDERLVPRTINSKLDLGAVETNYSSVQFVQQPTNALMNTDISPAVTLSITESGVTVAGIPLTVTFSGTGALHGTLTESTVAPAVPTNPAVATYSDLNGDTAGTGDTLVANVVITPSGISPAQTITATSDLFDITKITADVPVVTVGPASPVFGQPNTVTITVPTTNGVPPGGTVIVYNNGVQVGTGTLGPNGSVAVTLAGGTLPAGPASITVGYGGDGNYGSSTSATVPVTVAPVVSVPTVTVGPASLTVGQPATVTVRVPTVGSSPATGTVNIYDNGNQIGTGTLGSNGTVTVNIPGGLPAGSNNITANYPGGGNYSSSTSATVPVTVGAAVVLDFTLTRTSAQSQTIITGQAATIALQVAPTNGTYPGNVSFTATGLPANATATFTPATIATNGGPVPVSLSIQTASLVGMNRPGGDETSIALGLLLLPFFGAKRKRLFGTGRVAGRYLFMMLVLIAGAIGMAGLTGCGSNNGFFGHAPQTYNITITATSGTIQHSVNATLNVQ